MFAKLLVGSLALIVLLGFMSACKGGGKEPLPGQTATAGPSRTADGDLSQHESELRQTVTDAAQALIQNDIGKYYSYFSPDYQQRCPVADFEKISTVARTLVGDLSGATFNIEKIEFQADRALVTAYIDAQGTKRPFDGESQYPSYWVFMDGAWKVTNDNPAPCQLFPPTPVAAH